MLERAHEGTFHGNEPRSSPTVVDGFAYRHDNRGFGTVDQTSLLARSMPRETAHQP